MKNLSICFVGKDNIKIMNVQTISRKYFAFSRIKYIFLFFSPKAQVYHSFKLFNIQFKSSNFAFLTLNL